MQAQQQESREKTAMKGSQANCVRVSTAVEEPYLPTNSWGSLLWGRRNPPSSTSELVDVSSCSGDSSYAAVRGCGSTEESLTLGDGLSQGSLYAPGECV